MKRGYSKKKKCADCGRLISNRAKKCKGCAHKKPEQEEKSPSLLAWRYDCQCGTVAYGFASHGVIQGSCGHDIARGPRVICNSGRFYDYCPECGVSGRSHMGRRKNEMFYEALCPSVS